MERLELRAMLSADPLASMDPVDDHSALHHDHPDVRVTASGAAYYLDHFYDEQHSLDPSPTRAQPADEGDEDTSGDTGETNNAPVTQVPAYESLPGAANIFYLDFTGDTVTDTDWNKDFEDRPIHALPFDRDGDTTTYSATELAWIHEIWQRVSEDYVPFNINVTTVAPKEPTAFGHHVARVIITSNRDAESLGGTGEVWFPDAGGVAFVGSWVTNRDAPGWVFHDAVPNTAKGIAEAVAHEFGHMVGLSHHGDSESDYYGGHGEGETSWAPIMGSGYRRNLTQWSQGKYANASNSRQDDIDVITNRHNGISIRQDDHGDEPTPLELVNDTLLRAEGVIETRSDVDTFRFTHPGGPLQIQIHPAAVGGNLDIAAVFYDATRNLGDFVPEDTVGVEIIDDLAPGEYFLEVEGIGHVPDTGQGYSDYGSLGVYSIEVQWGPQIVAHAGGDYSIDEGMSLLLDASQSTGTDGGATFAWDLDSDGEYDDALGEQVEVTWQELGELPVPIVDQTTFVVGLEIRTPDGTAHDTASVSVANVAPSLLGVPQTGYAGGTTLLTITATDVMADPLLFEWDFGDNTNKPITSSSTVVHRYEAPGEYTVTVQAGDDEGATKSIQFVVQIDFPIAGDANYDGQVTFSDFLVLSANFGNEVATWDQGDFNQDGVVGFADFLLLSANFGNETPS